jgi:4,5-DOPA dioxygenase extradiol
VNFHPEALTPDWSLEFDHLITTAILENNLTQLLKEDSSKEPLWKMSHPTIEHYLPLLYTLGASHPDEKIVFPYVGFEGGSLSMRSVLIGNFI